MKNEVKNYGHSIRNRLLNIANSTSQPFLKILPRYFQERILYRLSLSSYKNNFLLKGGTLLYAHYNFEARPTVDIDFLGKQINRDIDNIKEVFNEILSIEVPEDGVYFDTDSIKTSEITLDKEYNGVRLEFIAHLDTIVLPMSMDIGFGDIVTPCPQNLEYPTILTSLPKINILAYSLETVLAEKFEAMISLGEQNSRMKDFFDVYRILIEDKLKKENISVAIKNTFANRKTVLVKIHPLFSDEFYEDKNRTAFWNGFLKKIKWKEPIDFRLIGEEIIGCLRPVYLELLAESEAYQFKYLGG